MFDSLILIFIIGISDCQSDCEEDMKAYQQTPESDNSTQEKDDIDERKKS